MSEKTKYEQLPASAFERVPMEGRMHDKKLESKPVGYFRDAFNRFCRNKSSVVAAIIILMLVLYSIVVPWLCQNNYTRALTDTMYLNYGKLPPKVEGLEWMGFSGTEVITVNENDFYKLRAIADETGLDPIVEIIAGPYQDPSFNGKGKATMYYDLRVDEYYRMGMMYMTVTQQEYDAIQAWQDEHQIQIIFPAITDSKQSDANIWYKADKKGKPTLSKVDKDGDGFLELTNIYKTTTPTDTSYHSTMRIAADNDPEKPLAYARKTGTSSAPGYVIRVSKYNYFQYRYGFEPAFVFGTNANGQDIFTRLASGARFSFLLAIGISAINLFIGAIYGAIEGYYGGAVDLVMERVSDVLSGVPFMVVTTLFQLHLAKQVGPVWSLLFAFVLTGWIGMAARVRMQFYRFKGQEYILAARTLGAGDFRLMFKHIFPNSLGTIITGTVLVIPGVIFSESSLTYLGIVNLESSTRTSVGTMLANGRGYLSTDPYIILFPALFISLLEISFNLFGNGLRDAFNPSLRGTE
ncbi:MAG: ABC transporter permease [Clostridia bacterium]|nr:ABC transporter permease [Clostridia bacterium]